MKPGIKTAAIIAAVSFCTLLVFSSALLAIEGLPTVSSVAREWSAPRSAAERLHTRFDPELGWANLPNLRLADFYSSGAALSTNSKGFRGAREYSPKPAEGRIRVVCSGDSFTLGHGVGDADSWPARLEASDPRLETVNLGQGGYGVDQSYLRYLRDAKDLEFSLHVLAFTYVDFERMQGRDFFGYPKPTLAVEDGGLRAVPPPGPPATGPKAPWLAKKSIALHRLKTIRWFETLARRFWIDSADARTRSLSVAVLEALDADARSRGASFIAVYLPTRMDLPRTNLDAFRGFLGREAKARGIAFVDLTDDFRRLPEREIDRLFLDGNDAKFLGSDGHYSPAGNDFVARLLKDRLSS